MMPNDLQGDTRLPGPLEIQVMSETDFWLDFIRECGVSGLDDCSRVLERFKARCRSADLTGRTRRIRGKARRKYLRATCACAVVAFREETEKLISRCFAGERKAALDIFWSFWFDHDEVVVRQGGEDLSGRILKLTVECFVHRIRDTKKPYLNQSPEGLRTLIRKASKSRTIDVLRECGRSTRRRAASPREAGNPTSASVSTPLEGPTTREARPPICHVSMDDLLSEESGVRFDPRDRHRLREYVEAQHAEGCGSNGSDDFFCWMEGLAGEALEQGASESGRRGTAYLETVQSILCDLSPAQQRALRVRYEMLGSERADRVAQQVRPRMSEGALGNLEKRALDNLVVRLIAALEELGPELNSDDAQEVCCRLARIKPHQADRVRRAEALAAAKARKAERGIDGSGE